MSSWFVRNRNLVFAATALLITPVAARYTYERLRFQNTVKAAQLAHSSRPAAYTLHLAEVVRKGPMRDSPAELATESTIAQRSDGARSETRIFFPGKPQEHRERVVRFPDGTKVIARDSIGMKTTWAPNGISNAGLSVLGRPTSESECALNDLGRPAAPAYRRAQKAHLDAIGLDAVEFIAENPHIEVWRAPQVGCEEVYRFAAFAGPDGKVTDSSERYAKSCSAGEPDPKLFDVAALQEASPITSFEAQYRRVGYPESLIEQEKAKLKSSEDRYWAARK